MEISEQTFRKLKAFKKVIDTVLEEELPSDSAYAELVLSIGLERMLQDPLPKEEALLKTMVALFNKNPEFISDFIAATLKKGKEKEEKQVEEVTSYWKRYVVQ